jgi:hypothetical protein
MAHDAGDCSTSAPCVETNVGDAWEAGFGSAATALSLSAGACASVT